MLLRFMKRVDTANKLCFPKFAVEKFGRYYYFEIHEDKIILIPIRKEK